MKQINSFYKEGHFTLKKFLKEKEKKMITKTFFKILSKYININKDLKKINFKTDIINKKIINFRKKNPKLFSDFYDELCLNSSLKSIFFSERFFNLFAKILKTQKEYIYVNGFMLRLDSPNDTRNSVDWHIDSFFFEQTSPHFNSAVCQLPLTDFNNFNGSIEFIPKSQHKIFKSKTLKKDSLIFKRKSKLSTYSATIPVSEKEKEEAQFLNASFGDASFIHVNLKHRTFKNNSKKMRLSLICRFHDSSKKFNIGKEFYIYNKTGKKTLKY